MNPLLADPRRLNELHDRAHDEAEALRRAALDDLWRGADAALAGVATGALRAARRFAHRLQRRRALERGQV